MDFVLDRPIKIKEPKVKQEDTEKEMEKKKKTLLAELDEFDLPDKTSTIMKKKYLIKVKKDMVWRVKKSVINTYMAKCTNLQLQLRHRLRLRIECKRLNAFITAQKQKSLLFDDENGYPDERYFCKIARFLDSNK